MAGQDDHQSSQLLGQLWQQPLPQLAWEHWTHSLAK